MARPNKTKEKILEAAAECFAEKGYQRASVDEITLKADVAKGSFYYNFKSKEAVLYGVIEWGISIIERETDKLIQSDKEDKETLKSIIVLYVNLILDYPDLSAVIFTSRTEYLSPEWKGKIRELTERSITNLAEQMENGARWGILRETDYSLAAAGLFGLLWNCCDYYLRHEEGRTREDIYRTLFETFLNGLLKEENNEGQAD